MYSSESITELLPALVAFRKGCGPVVKESTAQIRAGQPYRYADLQAVIEATTPALLENNLVVVQVIDTEHGVLVTRLWHASSGQWLESRFPLNFDQGIQGIGSALTYARRYSLLALLCVAAEDDDGASAQRAEDIEKRRPASDLPEAPRTRPLTSDAATITPAQVDRLWEVARAAGWTDDALVGHLKFRYQVRASAEIKAADFDELVVQLAAGPPEVL
jgi:hypothetical protein